MFSGSKFCGLREGVEEDESFLISSLDQYELVRGDFVHLASVGGPSGEMPGEKRRLDEDTWLVNEAKRRKMQRESNTVYETTLAKLRMGSRHYFGQHQHHQQENQSARSVGNENVLNTDICQKCMEVLMRRSGGSEPFDNWENCAFCDKKVCHVNFCSNCNLNFCSKCSIQRFESSDYEEIYTCFGCFAEVQ